MIANRSLICFRVKINWCVLILVKHIIDGSLSLINYFSQLSSSERTMNLLY